LTVWAIKTTRASPRRGVFLILSTEYSVLTRAVLAALLCVFAFLSSAIADDAKPLTDPVQAAKESLASGSRFPWYDRRKDDVRRLNMLPRNLPEDRGVTWTDNKTPTPPPAWNWRLGWLGTLLEWLGITTLIVLLGIIGYLIATAFLKDEVSESDGLAVRKVVETRCDADRVEALPFHLRAARGDFLAEARRLYEAGRYSDAIVYLFSYQLVELDKQHVIRLTKGKTNRQYVRESRQRPLLSSVLATTMVAFEEAFFGRKTLSREAFERCWQRLDEFHGELAQLERAAA